MIELQTTRAEQVYEELAHTGKYFNTGKVLMGVGCEPRARTLSYSEEIIQSALLTNGRPRITAGTWRYIAFVVMVLGGLFVVHAI
jgi:hypothetical protein